MITQQISERLGASVREYRLDMNLTQAQLASKSGVSLSTIKKLETGKGCHLDLFIDVLRALSRLNDLDNVLPKIGMRPTERLKIERGLKPKRVRATGKRR
jgi:transcriptional regulator with XRE-family HTH domain